MPGAASMKAPLLWPPAVGVEDLPARRQGCRPKSSAVGVGVRTCGRAVLRPAAQKLEELLGCGRELLAAPVDDSDRPGQARAAERDSCQPFLLYLFRHRGFRQNADSGPDRDRFFDHLDVVELQYRLGRYAAIAQKTVQRFADHQILI